MTSTAPQPNWKKFLIQILAGAIVGGVSALLVLQAFDDVGSLEPARLFSLLTGLIYALMGLMVGFGAMAPGAGARVLNVEDAEELRDQQTVLVLSATACVLIGLLLLLLATVPAGGDDGLFGHEIAAVLAGTCVIALIVLSRITNRLADEFTRHIGMESSSLAMHASFVVFGGWATLAQLGFVQWIAPLALVAGMASLQLIAIFWVSAKRGLMVPPKVSLPRPS